MAKTKLFSVTRDDFDWQYYRGSGAGGQHRAKTSSACRCIHRESGAFACAEDHREQPRNRQLAFQRCVATKKFQVWLKCEIARRSGEKSIEEEVDIAMKMLNLKIEGKDENGRWTEVELVEDDT